MWDVKERKENQQERGKVESVEERLEEREGKTGGMEKEREVLL
jgi:hypothetical protein